MLNVIRNLWTVFPTSFTVFPLRNMINVSKHKTCFLFIYILNLYLISEAGEGLILVTKASC